MAVAAVLLAAGGAKALADYKVVSFEKTAGILTVDQSGGLKSFRVASFTDVTINGVRAVAEQLRAGMIVTLTLTDQQTVVRIVARGNPGSPTAAAAGTAPKTGLPVLAPLPAMGAPVGVRKISLKLRVDGQDTVKVRDGQLWIEHNGWGKPEAITINGVRWHPQWQGKRTENFTGFAPPLAPFGTSVVSVRKHLGRGEVKMIEPPTNANEQTLSIYLDDKKGGSDIYDVRISW